MTKVSRSPTFNSRRIDRGHTASQTFVIISGREFQIGWMGFGVLRVERGTDQSMEEEVMTDLVLQHITYMNQCKRASNK